MSKISVPRPILRSLLIIVVFCGAATSSDAQQHCWVKYTYDSAGNRTQRSWWCGTPGSEELPGSPKSAQAKESYGLVVAPNPANTEFSLRSETDLAGAECRITDAQGRTAITQKATGNVVIFDVSGLSQGAYTLFVRNGSEEFQTSIIIAH